MRTKNLILIVCSLFLLIGCTTYSRISLSGSDFYGRNKVIKNIDRYDVYVHQADSVYELVDHEALDSGRIKGTLKSLEAKDVPKKTVVNNDAKLKPGEQDDIHIFIDDEPETADLKPADEITLEAKNVENVKMTASDSSGTLGVVGIVVLGILLLLVAAVLLIVLAVTSASEGSGSDSGDSGSYSGDSGCYIATMAYGSYEAPKVMTLRRFRDQFLQKYGWGRAFIQWYYRNSPGFVAKHQSKKWLHTILRGGLDVFVFILKPFFK